MPHIHVLTQPHKCVHSYIRDVCIHVCVQRYAHKDNKHLLLSQNYFYVEMI